MENIKKVVGNNLQELRKRKKLTQSELAEMLNYSDKAISKWENGDTLPDIEVLYDLCTFYGVTLDYLTSSEKPKDKKQFIKSNVPFRNKIVITCMLVTLVWMVATIGFIFPYIRSNTYFWQLFVWAIPGSCLCLLFSNGIYFKNKLLVFIVSTIFVWSILTCFCLQFLEYNLWIIYILGIPCQVSLILWANLAKKQK